MSKEYQLDMDKLFIKLVLMVDIIEILGIPELLCRVTEHALRKWNRFYD